MEVDVGCEKAAFTNSFNLISESIKKSQVRADMYQRKSLSGKII